MTAIGVGKNKQYSESKKKTIHFTFDHNFGKCRLIYNNTMQYNTIQYNTKVT